MPKKYTKRRTKRHSKRHSKTCHKKIRNRNKSYSKKRVYGGNNSNTNINRNERGKTTDSIDDNSIDDNSVTSNSIDGNPITNKKNVVMALSSGFVGTGQEYINHKAYRNFQGGDD